MKRGLLYFLLFTLIIGTATAWYIWFDMPKPLPSGARQVLLMPKIIHL